MLLDPEVLGDELADLVLEQVAKATEPLREQVRQLTAKLEGFRQPQDGRDADPDVIRREVALAVSEIPRPKDGASVDVAQLSEQIIAAAAKAVEALPRPKDGRDYDQAVLEAAVERAVAAIPKPKDGADADAKAIAADVMVQVTRALESIPLPKDGKDADPEVMRSVIRDEVRLAVADLPKPADGESVDMVELSGQIMEAAVKAVAAIPPPKDGLDFDPEIIKAEVERAVAALPKPKDGHTPSREEITSLVADAVERAVKALPAPQNGEDGKSVSVEELRGEIQKAVDALPKARDGDDGKTPTREELAPLVRAEVEHAIAGFPKPADGKSVTLDEVRPVLEGEVGRWALEFERRANDTLQRAVERMPAPKDGVDGLNLDDFEAETKDGGRILVLKLRAGDRQIVRELQMDVVIDRGVFSQGKSYEKGDCVTYGGSMFIAKAKTANSPPGDDWRLSVKRGQNGKDAQS